MPVGDVQSNAPGSGARYNDGKTPYELLPLRVVVAQLDEMIRPDPGSAEWYALEVLRSLGEWQHGNDSALADALSLSVHVTGNLHGFAPGARVFDYGRRKYAAWNWAKGMPWSVPLGCAARHCEAIIDGETNDPESGHPHMGHVQCNLLMLATFAETYREGDDRPSQWLAPKRAAD